MTIDQVDAAPETSARDGAPSPVVILLKSLIYLRNFEAPIRQLAARGHHIVVLSDSEKADATETDQQVARLKSDLGRSIAFQTSQGRKDFRRHWVLELQSARDILRYRDPRFDTSPSARERSVRKAQPIARSLFRRRRRQRPEWDRHLLRAVERMIESVPTDPSIVVRLTDLRPAVLVVSPLIDFNTAQADWIRAARELSIPTVLAVASWDNLTNKTTLHATPDRVVVWNDDQRREAAELHGIAPHRVIVAGAPLYDHWFERRPSRTYEAFCKELGLDPARPLLLYAGSSFSIARREHTFVREWLEHLRHSAPEPIRGANVLIRPHPFNQRIYADAGLEEFAPVAIHPRRGGLPVTEGAKAEYFDALYHCSAVIGLNTSALIEAAILSKQCFTPIVPANETGQGGTVHFSYLTGSGIVSAASGFDEHFAQLARHLDNPARDNEKLAAFVGHFLRPNGIDRPATPAFVEAIEDMIVSPPEPLPKRAPLKGRRLLDAPAFLLWMLRETAASFMPSRSPPASE